jgi:hypothetical protein
MVRKILFAACAALLLVPGTSFADSPTRDHLGGCRWLPSTEPTPGTTNGSLYIAAVVYSTAEPTANPVSATVTCEVVGDVVFGSALSATGTGVVTAFGAQQIVVAEGGYAELCETITYDNGEVDQTCSPLRSSIQIPPQDVVDLLNGVFAEVDPLVCAELARLAPGVPGVVDITSEGDVFRAGEWLWDCPPYGSPAGPPDAGTRQHIGGCGWHNAVEGTHPSTAAGWWGHLYSATVVYSVTDPAANPVSATVTCTLKVDGVVADDGTYTWSGTGVVAGVSLPFRYFGYEDSYVEVCTRVAYDNGEVDTSCDPFTTTYIPPQEVVDVLNDVLTVPDPVVCPVLGGLAPGQPGIVDVTPEGDVYVAGEWFWDCPPYRA